MACQCLRQVRNPTLFPLPSICLVVCLVPVLAVPARDSLATPLSPPLYLPLICFIPITDVICSCRAILCRDLLTNSFPSFSSFPPFLIDRQASPQLSLLGSNNPFRNRAMSPAVNPGAPRTERSSTNPFMDDTDALSPQSAPSLQPVRPLQPEAVDNTRELFVRPATPTSTPSSPRFRQSVMEMLTKLCRKTCRSNPHRARLPLVLMSLPKIVPRLVVRIGTVVSDRRVNVRSVRSVVNVPPANDADLASVPVAHPDVIAKRTLTSLPIPRLFRSLLPAPEPVLVNADPVATPNPPSWNDPNLRIPRRTVAGENVAVVSVNAKVVTVMASRRGPRDPSTWTLLTNWMSLVFMELAVCPPPHPVLSFELSNPAQSVSSRWSF